MVDLKSLLASARTIAVFGCSDQPLRTSHRIARYLQSVGYRIIPVNPNHEEVLGETCYPDLLSVPQDAGIDIVNVFRRPQFMEDVIDQVKQRVTQTGEKLVIWTQIGVSSPRAQQRAEQENLPYVANRCIMVEHARYF